MEDHSLMLVGALALLVSAGTLLVTAVVDYLRNFGPRALAHPILEWRRHHHEVHRAG